MICIHGNRICIHGNRGQIVKISYVYKEANRVAKLLANKAWLADFVILPNDIVSPELGTLLAVDAYGTNFER